VCQRATLLEVREFIAAHAAHAAGMDVSRFQVTREKLLAALHAPGGRSAEPAPLLVPGPTPARARGEP
jgi:hypothetical protein